MAIYPCLIILLDEKGFGNPNLSSINGEGRLQGYMFTPGEDNIYLKFGHCFEKTDRQTDRHWG